MFAPVRHLAEHARARPDALALVGVDGRWSFAELERAVSAVASRLRALGIGPRQLVVTDLPPSDDWIVTLALFRIATRTLSFAGAGSATGLTADALLTRPGEQRLDARQVVAIDRLWIEQAIADAEQEPDDVAPTVLYPRDDAIARVILTSGTTGSPRGVELSLRAIEHRLANLHRYWTDARVEVNLMTLSTTGGFHTALAALQHGSPFLAVDIADERFITVAAEARVQVLCGSPVQVGQTLRLLRASGQTLPQLAEVRLAGALPTAGLLEAIAQQLSVPVRGVYGSTEGGGVTMRMLHLGGELSDVGRPIAGVELDIVDEGGASVPRGESGDVRYRSPGLASGYTTVDDEQSFRNGWFYPGDRGRITAGGTLVIEGRTAEIVNVGGVKIDPAMIDAAVEGFPGVIDAATFVIEQVPGIPELGLAVVADTSCDLRALDRLLRQRLPGKHPTVYGQVSVIPRNRMGKVERGRLTDEFRRRLNLG